MEEGDGCRRGMVPHATLPPEGHRSTLEIHPQPIQSGWPNVPGLTPLLQHPSREQTYPGDRDRTEEGIGNCPTDGPSDTTGEPTGCKKAEHDRSWFEVFELGLLGAR
jgi:hypothetical protein